MSQDTLTDRIYEAAFNPDEWVTVLDTIGTVSSSSGGCVTILNGNLPIGARQSAVIRDLGTEATRNPHPATIDRLMYAYANPAHGFRAASAFFPQQRVDGDHFLDMKKSRGCGEGAFSIIPLPGGETAMFSIDRPLANGS